MTLRQSKRDRARGVILEICEALFRAKGFDGTSIDDIAAGAEISRQTFFNYFPGKEAALTELGLIWLQRQVLLPGEGSGATAVSVLAEARRVVSAQARAIEADREFMRLVISHAGLFAPDGEAAGRRRADHSRALFLGVAEVIRAGQASGEIRAGIDALRAAEVYVSSMLMTVRLWLTGYWPAGDSLEDRVNAAIDVIEGGLRAGDGR